MSYEASGKDISDPLAHFQQVYQAALEATVVEIEPVPSGDDLTRLREKLLRRPAGEPEELSRTRQAILDDPEKLRRFFGVFSHHDAALRRIEADGSLTLL